MSNSHNAASNIFGQPIDSVIKVQQARGVKSDVPQLVTDLILWLESNQGMHHCGLSFLSCFYYISGLEVNDHLFTANLFTAAITTPNIFRLLGHQPTVQQIKSEFEGNHTSFCFFFPLYHIFCYFFFSLSHTQS